MNSKSVVTRRVSSVHKNAVVGLTERTWDYHRRDLFAYWKSRGVDFARLPTQNIDESRLEACTKENLFAFYFYYKHLIESDPEISRHDGAAIMNADEVCCFIT